MNTHFPGGALPATTSATTPSRRHQRNDDGATLVEILVSVVLLGSIVLALLTAVYTMIRTSSSALEMAQIETVLLNAGDQVERAGQQCNYDAYVEAAALAEGWPPESVTVTVEILASNTGDSVGDWAPQDCSVAVEPFDVQRLVIRADHPDLQLVRTLTVVKSNVN